MQSDMVAMDTPLLLLAISTYRLLIFQAIQFDATEIGLTLIKLDDIACC